MLGHGFDFDSPGSYNYYVVDEVESLPGLKRHT